MGITPTPTPTAAQGKASPGLCLALPALLGVTQELLASGMVWAEAGGGKEEIYGGLLHSTQTQTHLPKRSGGTSAVRKSSPASPETTEQSQRLGFFSWKKTAGLFAGRELGCAVGEAGMGHGFPSSTFPGSHSMVAQELLLCSSRLSLPWEMIHV